MLTRTRVAREFRSLWDEPKRRRTLARIVAHERQFENWWKFELATHLWELASELGAHVWVEMDDRSDIVLARSKDAAATAIDLSLSPRVPIELKTVGTFWTSAEKAYTEPGKKRLVHDMDAALVRACDPFAVVALLVTHAGKTHDPAMTPFLELARRLAAQRHMLAIVDEAIDLEESSPGRSGCAHQLAWTTA